MVNEQRLRRIATNVNRERGLRQKEEQEEKERQEQERHEAEVARRIKEWPAYIEKKIEEAALDGKFDYEYDCGPDCDDRVVKHLLAEFSSLNPKSSRVEKTRIVNYDMGTDENYWTTVVTFRW